MTNADTEKPFDSDLVRGKDILRDESYSIPKNQRPYTWKETNAADLYDDLMEAAKPTGSLFLGEILLFREEDGTYGILDGQQRITTIHLLLACLRHFFTHVHPDNGHRDAIHEQMNILDESDKTFIRTRLRPSPSISPVFENICKDSNWDGVVPLVSPYKVHGQRIKSVVDYFLKDELNPRPIPKLSKDAAIALYKALRDKTYLLSVIVKDTASAFDIFERANARGVDLAIEDLVKNFLFKNEVRDLSARWDAIQHNADDKLTTLLRQYHIYRKGYISKRELYPKLKTICTKDTAEVFVDRIYAYSLFFRACMDTKRRDSQFTLTEWFRQQDAIWDHHSRVLKRIEHSLYALARFSQRQFVPAFYGVCTKAANAPANARATAKKLEEVARAFESLHFTNNWVCGEPANVLEIPYADIGKQMSDPMLSFEASCDALITFARSKRKERTLFIERFKQLNYVNNFGLIQYIFQTLLGLKWDVPQVRFEKHHLGRARERSVWSYDRGSRGLYEVHHFEPKIGVPPGSEGALHWKNRIGNLLPVSQEVNSIFGSNDPSSQASLISSNVTVKELFDAESFLKHFDSKFGSELRSGSVTWSEQVVHERSAALASLAYDDVWYVP